ncbi:hypothetical protein [Saccharothrix australiensis]|uniref:Uncharacterized protein n=1 Tax=Saccharothrix australiensis TaxID=2072 RepID=A0A495VSZ7_9PSEU|nr:hypothetical protein [Saccharothrix australiensis]RKT52469.1 hypothetical protein C8E97_0983 [Saccharothrix australiensis]
MAIELRVLPGWLLDFGHRTDVFTVDDGAHVRGLRVEEVFSMFAPGHGEVRLVWVEPRTSDSAQSKPDGREVPLFAEGDHLDPTRPLGPQILHRRRDDPVRLQGMASLKKEADAGAGIGELARRHRLHSSVVSRMLKAAEAELDPTRPIGPQIIHLPLQHPVRVEGEAIVAKEYLAGVNPSAVASRFAMSPYMVRRAVERFLGNNLLPELPIGPQIRTRRLDDPVRLRGEATVAHQFVNGIDRRELCRRHKISQPTLHRYLVRAGVLNPGKQGSG